MIKDWHETQNDDYLELLIKRLKQEKLTWVKQFTEIINNFIIENNIKKVSINDIGCNVGHFFKAIEDLKADIDYKGYDLSNTYLAIAKDCFNVENFYKLDISKNLPSETDVSIISATLEHIPDHITALENIANSTRELVLIRTFIGDEFLEEYCKKDNSLEPYLIKQFKITDIQEIFSKFVWDIELIEDMATNGIEKKVCNENSIIRKQKILVFKRK